MNASPEDPTLLWYDYETTGIDPAVDRPLQFAARRTTLALEPVGAPVNLWCRLPPDVLPHPEACLLTGIAPQHVERDGLAEAEFAAQIHAALAQPGTCSVGYNTVRFDDEINRHLFYRNFFDPYAHTWQDGTSRWDIIDLVRGCYALRPEGIEWPRYEDGRPCFKLDRLAPANRLDQAHAHDAGSDVTATIALARLIRSRQPKLYEWHFAAQDKNVVAMRMQPALQAAEMLVHVSSRYPSERGGLALVVPLAQVPDRKPGSAWIVADLTIDPEAWMQLAPDDLRERLFTRREDLPDDVTRPPLKTVQANRVPFIAPPSVLRDADAERLGIDVAAARRNLETLRACSGLRERVEAVFRDGVAAHPAHTDPELALYGGFLNDADRRACERTRNMAPEALRAPGVHFEDARLRELLFRYRARNWPDSLGADELPRWQDYVRDRLSGRIDDRMLTLDQYRAAIAQLRETTLAGAGQAMLDQLEAWGMDTAARWGL
ncbi:MAG: exodeoxyribonuclease I [Nevskiaceae bacterium]|nr:MAG: exodeoxyribonuclease I [Nevskiaceae bacterium]TBR72212.1 MAG: exodeoxyribonuclease I [Nevskiaceae bacterium]